MAGSTNFARLEHGIPVVDNATARDALFPHPAADQSVRRKDSGMIDRWDTVAAQWLPEGVTRSAGPIVGSKAKGCKADGVTNDGPVLAAAGAFGAAITTIGIGELDVGQHVISTNCTIPGHIRPHRGAELLIGANTTVTFSGTVEEVLYPWIRKMSGTSHVIFSQRIFAHWFFEQSISIPNPTVAPVLDCGNSGEGAIVGEGAVAAGLKHRFYVVGVGHKDSRDCRQLSAFYGATPNVEVPAQATPAQVGIDFTGCFPRGYPGKGLAILWQKETAPSSGVFTVLKRATYIDAGEAKHEGSTISTIFRFSDCNEDTDGYFAVPMDDDSNAFWVMQEGVLGGSGGATTLTAGISATDVTLQIASNANLPHDPGGGTFTAHGGIVKIDNEFIRYNRSDGTHLYSDLPASETRGLFGTTPAAHLNAAAVTAHTLDCTGADLAAPSAAPTWKLVHSMPNAAAVPGGFYAKYTRVDDSGVESAPSPKSNNKVMRATGGPATVYFADSEPSGTVRRALYLSTDDVTYRFQRYCGVGFGSADIHKYVTTSRTLGAGGAPANIVCPEFQAWDANDDSGGGHTVICRKGVFTVYCPFIQRQSNTAKTGSCMIGAAGVDNWGGETGTMFVYKGNGTCTDEAGVGKTASSPGYGVEMHVVNVSKSKNYGLGFVDQQQKCYSGKRYYDLTGGGGFFNEWEDCVWAANHISGRGVGLICNNESQGAGGGHTASEDTHYNCYLQGPMRAIHLSGQQTTNWRFYSCHTACDGGFGAGPAGSYSASSTENLYADGVKALFEATQHQAGGQDVHAVTEHPTTRRTAGPCTLILRHDYIETGTAAAYVVCSELMGKGGSVEISGATDMGQSIATFYDILLMAPTEVSVANSILRGRTYEDNHGATIRGDRKTINWLLHDKSFRFAPSGQNYRKRTTPSIVANAIGFSKPAGGGVIALEKLHYEGIIVSATIGTIAAAGRLTLTLSCPGVEFGDVFERPTLFSGAFPGNGPWVSIFDTGLRITDWAATAFGVVKLELYNPTGAGITPGVDYNWFLRGERTRPALINQFSNRVDI